MRDEQFPLRDSNDGIEGAPLRRSIRAEIYRDGDDIETVRSSQESSGDSEVKPQKESIKRGRKFGPSAKKSRSGKEGRLYINDNDTAKNNPREITVKGYGEEPGTEFKAVIGDDEGYKDSSKSSLIKRNTAEVNRVINSVHEKSSTKKRARNKEKFIETIERWADDVEEHIPTVENIDETPKKHDEQPGEVMVADSVEKTLTAENEPEGNRFRAILDLEARMYGKDTITFKCHSTDRNVAEQDARQLEDTAWEMGYALSNVNIEQNSDGRYSVTAEIISHDKRELLESEIDRSIRLGTDQFELLALFQDTAEKDIRHIETIAKKKGLSLNASYNEHDKKIVVKLPSNISPIEAMESVPPRATSQQTEDPPSQPVETGTASINMQRDVPNDQKKQDNERISISDDKGLISEGKDPKKPDPESSVIMGGSGMDGVQTMPTIEASVGEYRDGTGGAWEESALDDTYGDPEKVGDWLSNKYLENNTRTEEVVAETEGAIVLRASTELERKPVESSTVNEDEVRKRIELLSLTRKQEVLERAAVGYPWYGATLSGKHAWSFPTFKRIARTFLRPFGYRDEITKLNILDVPKAYTGVQENIDHIESMYTKEGVTKKDMSAMVLEGNAHERERQYDFFTLQKVIDTYKKKKNEFSFLRQYDADTGKRGWIWESKDIIFGYDTSKMNDSTRKSFDAFLSTREDIRKRIARLEMFALNDSALTTELETFKKTHGISYNPNKKEIIFK